MVRRLCILCFLVGFWPGLALAQSAAFMDAFNQYKALDTQGQLLASTGIRSRCLSRKTAVSGNHLSPFRISCSSTANAVGWAWLRAI